MSALQPTIKNILITGSPGIGKSTCLLQVAEALRDKKNRYASMVNVRGFYSQERRKKTNYGKGARIGFDIVSLVDGKANILARTEQELPQYMYNKYKTGMHSSSFRFVSKYIMDIVDFEQYILPMMREHKNDKKNAHKQTVFVLDEIGKMELFSKRFERAAERILNNPEYIVMAIVPLKHKISFVEKVKRRKDSKLFTMTHSNRNSMVSYIGKCLFEIIDSRASTLGSVKYFNDDQKEKVEADDEETNQSKNYDKATNKNQNRQRYWRKRT